MFDFASTQHANSISCSLKFLTVSNFDTLHLLQATSSKNMFRLSTINEETTLLTSCKGNSMLQGLSNKFFPSNYAAINLVQEISDENLCLAAR